MSVIDDLLASTPDPQREALQHIRELVLASAPGADEVMTYGMPGFKYKGKYLISFAAFKNHMSLFPGAMTTPDVHARLSEFQTSKGTLQFTLEKPVPDDLVTTLVKKRVQEIETKANRKR